MHSPLPPLVSWRSWQECWPCGFNGVQKFSRLRMLWHRESKRANIMGSQISWQVELAVKSDEVDNFRSLTREMVEFTKTEPGVLIYERFISNDGQFVWVYERFVDSDAAVAHLQAFRTLYGER